MARQLLQIALLLREQDGAAAFLLLERPLVECVQPLPDGLVQFPQREELLVAQCGENGRREVPDRAFHRCLVLRPAHARRDDGRSIVLRQFLVRFVEHHFVFRVFVHARFQVVRHQDARHAAKVPVRVHMRRDPGCRRLIQERFRVCIATVRKYRHE